MVERHPTAGPGAVPVPGRVCPLQWRAAVGSRQLLQSTFSVMIRHSTRFPSHHLSDRRFRRHVHEYVQFRCHSALRHGTTHTHMTISLVW